MFKFLLLFLIGTIFTTSVYAQSAENKTWKNFFIMGPGLSHHIGFWSDRFKTGYSGSLMYERKLSDKLSATVSAELFNFHDKAISISDEKLEGVPVKLGLKYYVVSTLYFSGEAGVVTYGYNNNTHQSFIYAPGIGFDLPITNRSAINLGLRYDKWTFKESPTQQIALKVAFKLGW
jgi:hypothetical protein